jgi:hypothetical protein
MACVIPIGKRTSNAITSHGKPVEYFQVEFQTGSHINNMQFSIIINGKLIATLTANIDGFVREPRWQDFYFHFATNISPDIIKNKHELREYQYIGYITIIKIIEMGKHNPTIAFFITTGTDKIIEYWNGLETDISCNRLFSDIETNYKWT